MCLVAGGTGDCACGQGTALVVEYRHIVPVFRAKAVQKSHVRMVQVFWQVAFRVSARTVAACAPALAVVALRWQTLCPRSAAEGSRVDQMAGAAGTGLRGDLAPNVARLGRGFPQIVRRIQDLPVLGMASEAECRIDPRGSQQLWGLLVLMDVMTSRAGDK